MTTPLSSSTPRAPEAQAPQRVDVRGEGGAPSTVAPSPHAARDAGEVEALRTPALPPRDAVKSSGGGIAGPAAIGVGIAVFAMFGGGSGASDPSVLAPVVGALQGLGQLTLACAAAGLVYATLKTTGAPLPPSDDAARTREPPPEAGP